MNKTPPARPNLGFKICHLSLFPLGSADSRVIFILPPRASARRECWSNLSTPGGHQGQLWAGLPEVWTIRCALRTRYVQLLSGFVGTAGGLAGLVLPFSRMSCRTGIPSLIGMSRDEVYSFIDRESLSWAKLGHPCRDLNFRKPCPRLWADGNLLTSGCRKPEIGRASCRERV